MAKPSFVAQNLNHNSRHSFQLSNSSIDVFLPILRPRKKLDLSRRRLPSQALGVRCSFRSITPPSLPSNHLRGFTRESLFFASLSTLSIGHLTIPIRAVVSGMGKCLDIYSGVLMVRVLLSWFPNLPWECQPFSAIRDLCDPYLDLFRNIIPPIFGNLDVSPIFAFTILGVIVSILKGTPGVC
ncbi:hypothetical protein HPP92_019234 [Vanilla planifolia]|uniref:Uncharacterized protein n=1 Tax=Vanilla planifolia TaxID=51239 RepID=A0A835UK55_VANPL|nr:hypothetical protein HPP92_019774 [Vanilla planifolia]KAG0465070.1 hypothetical protein HPP92_019234 [Vanilla planifolia]